MKITVVTPTIRKEGLDVVKKALKAQSFTEYEWLIGSSFDPEIEEAIWVKDDFKDGYWTLNRIYNRLFEHARGELIVSLQDWIWVQKDGLEKFWTNYEATEKKAVISGVGDQYERLNKWGKPEIKIWSDPRKNLENGSFYECYPNDAEWNWCAIPMQAIIDAGGMDEGLDFLGYGGDQLQISTRIDELGYKFFLDQTNESFTVRHSRDDFGGQEAWDKDHVLFNGKYDQRIMELQRTGHWPTLQKHTAILYKKIGEIPTVV